MPHNDIVLLLTIKYNDWMPLLSSRRITLQAATRILARQLVRLRQQIINLQGTRAQIRGIATHTQVSSYQSSIALNGMGKTKLLLFSRQCMLVLQFPQE